MTAFLNRVKTINKKEKTKYDASCKTVLASRTILALILKSVTWEYMFMDIKDIKRCIDAKVCIGDIAVHPGEFIRGMNTESNIFNEGKCYYDICFEAILKDKYGTRKIYFDIEAQNVNPPYPIEKRGFYYLGRMISEQYGTDFKNSHYEGIKKGYSIWICLNPKKKKRNTIIRYNIKPELIEGSYETKMEDYDMMSLVLINLGGREDEGKGIIRMLKVLFSTKMGIEMKQEILEREYSIQLTDEEKEDIEKMCNLSEGIEQRGIEIGLQRGLLQGKTEGIAIGRKEGIALGKYEGIAIGRYEGITIGKKEGIELGKSKGIIEERINILFKMIKKIYKVDTKEWLEGLTEKQLEKAKDIILDELSYEEFINKVENSEK